MSTDHMFSFFCAHLGAAALHAIIADSAVLVIDEDNLACLDAILERDIARC